MRALNVLLAVLVSLLLAAAVLEGGLRLLGLGPRTSILHYDSKLGWSKVPGLATTRRLAEGTVDIAINELGLHDDPMSNPAKPANTFRVLMLGDSFTQGFTVGREELFVDLLEHWWRAENRRADVINAGTEAWSTDQEVAWLLEHGSAFQPDLVVLFPYENDLYWNGEPLYVQRNTPKPLFKQDGTLESRALDDIGPPPWGDRFATTLLAKPLWGEGPDPRHFFNPDGGSKLLLKEFAVVLNQAPEFLSGALERTQGALIAMKKKCDELGARALVVPLPSHSAIDPNFRERFGADTLGVPADRWSPDKPVDTFLALAAKAGLDTLDPRSTLRAHATNGRELYFSRDWHLNPDGNRALAKFLHDEFDQRGLFPEGHRAPTGSPVPMPEVPKHKGPPTWIFVLAGLWLALGTLYARSYRDEPAWRAYLQVAGMLALVFGIAIGGTHLIGKLPPTIAFVLIVVLVGWLLLFILYKLGRRLATTFELFFSFTRRGHWYLLPLVVVLLSIGSLLVVAASSPLVAPFIYTLF